MNIETNELSGIADPPAGGGEGGDRPGRGMEAGGRRPPGAGTPPFGRPGPESLRAAYEALYELVKDKDYYLVTTVTDGAVYDTPFDGKRIGPLRQHPLAAVLRRVHRGHLGGEGEVPEDICPHCGAPLTLNTIQAETYIEEGYLPRWAAYKTWQAGTLNRSLLMLELGVGF